MRGRHGDLSQLQLKSQLETRFRVKRLNTNDKLEKICFLRLKWWDHVATFQWDRSTIAHQLEQLVLKRKGYRNTHKELDEYDAAKIRAAP
jgi:hypothetical protein